ncbi:MAG: HmuY family protein [Burkholderiaceae bacterium]
MKIGKRVGSLGLGIGIVLGLAACGGGGEEAVSSSPAPAPTPTPVAEASFSKVANWEATLPDAGQSVCYDFDAEIEVPDCGGEQWDLKLNSTGRSASVSSNSGPSGAGNGGVFGSPFARSWTDLLQWTNALNDPAGGAVPANLYFADSALSVFTGSNSIRSTAFEYALAGGDDRRLYPSYRVHLITTDSASASATGTAGAPVFALQVTGYYGGATGTESGHVSFQWIDRAAPAALRDATVDASQETAYFDLVAGAQTDASGSWHIAFNRYTAKLNGGESGAGTVAGYLARTPDGFYTAAGEPVLAAFQNATPASMASELQAELASPASARSWEIDSVTSQLQPDYQGDYPAPLDYGLYIYYPTAQAAENAGLASTANILGANPERGALIRSGEGDSYARFHVVNIQYADPADSSSQQTWTFEFGVQPAP